MERYGAADRTVALALHRLRAEGLIYSVSGSGWYVRQKREVVRSTRNRLSASERAAGRGAFSTDCHDAGLTPSVTTDLDIEPASDEVAMELEIAAGDQVLVRSRVMRGGDEVLQLATSYLSRAVTQGTPIEQTDTGPGGTYARLEELGHILTRFTERIMIGRADEHEARRMELTPGDPVYRLTRIAYASDRAVEVNYITITGDRYELVYELPAS